MGLSFEWDSAKAEANRRKHGVTFREAASVFRDPLAATVPDPDHSLGEERFVTLGVSVRRRLLVVVHADRDDTVRIISARTATPRERRSYEESDR